jgi:hypothetical protein
MDKLMNVRVSAITQKNIENFIEDEGFVALSRDLGQPPSCPPLERSSSVLQLDHTSVVQMQTSSSSSSSSSTTTTTSSSSSITCSISSSSSHSTNTSSLIISTNEGSPHFIDISTFVNQDHMIDAFRAFYPKARGRATCWNQQMNCRYSNIGRRIDFTLVDEKFHEAFVLKGPIGLDCGLKDESSGRREKGKRVYISMNCEYLMYRNVCECIYFII